MCHKGLLLLVGAESVCQVVLLVSSFIMRRLWVINSYRLLVAIIEHLSFQFSPFSFHQFQRAMSCFSQSRDSIAVACAASFFDATRCNFQSRPIQTVERTRTVDFALVHTQPFENLRVDDQHGHTWSINNIEASR